MQDILNEKYIGLGQCVLMMLTAFWKIKNV